MLNIEIHWVTGRSAAESLSKILHGALECEWSHRVAIEKEGHFVFHISQVSSVGGCHGDSEEGV